MLYIAYCKQFEVLQKYEQNQKGRVGTSNLFHDVPSIFCAFIGGLFRSNVNFIAYQQWRS